MALEVVTADSKQALKEFIEFPYSLYRDDPFWVPPLRIAVKELLDRARHPFYANAEAEFFLARCDGRVVGRIAAILDRNHNKFHEENAGFFGFFESTNNPEVAAVLRMIFGTGFQANYATLSALTEKGDVMICDHNLHASLVEGALRSVARVMRFRHNDLDHFNRCLNNCASEEKILVVSEGVFSMEGDLADLRGLVNLSKSNAARIYVDEAHGLGVLGRTGAGAAEHLGVLDEVDIVMGTFSKALASVGGFIAGPRDVVDYLKHTARPFVFSASLPAAAVAAAGAALEIIRNEPERRLRLLQIARALRVELRARGFSVLDGETAIVPVVIGEEGDLCRLCKALLAEKIYINPVLKPAAAQNLLRISCTSAHTEAHIERLVETLTKVAGCLGIER